MCCSYAHTHTRNGRKKYTTLTYIIAELHWDQEQIINLLLDHFSIAILWSTEPIHTAMNHAYYIRAYRRSRLTTTTKTLTFRQAIAIFYAKEKKQAKWSHRLNSTKKNIKTINNSKIRRYPQSKMASPIYNS